MERLLRERERPLLRLLPAAAPAAPPRPSATSALSPRDLRRSRGRGETEDSESG